MSRGLPRFTAQGQVATAGVSDPAGGARSLTELGQRVQGFGSQQLIQTAEGRAKEQGELAGMNPDFKPSTGGGATGAAFNDAALAANKTMLGTDVILNTQKLHFEANESSPDAAVALNNFNKSSQQYGQQLINQTPTENKPYIQNMLNFHIGTAQNKMMQGVQKQQGDRANAQWLHSDNAFHADTMAAIHNINFNQPPDEVAQGVAAAGALLAQRNTSTRLAAEGSIITRKVEDKQISNNNIEFQHELIAAHFKNKLEQGGTAPEQFLEQVEKASITGPGSKFLLGRSIFQRTALVKKLKGIQKLFSNASTHSNFMLNQGFKAEQDRVLNGATPNLIFRASYIARHPDRQAFYDNKIQVNQEVSQNVDLLNKSSFDEQTKQLDDLKPQNPNAKNFEQLNDIWKTTHSKMAQSNHEYNADKARWAASNPSVIASLNKKAAELRSGINFETMRSNGIKPLSSNPIDQLEVTQLMKGTAIGDISPATDSAANKIANMLRTASTGDKIQQLDSLRGTYGDHYSQLMTQLVRDDKISPMETFMTAVSPSDPNVTEIDSAINTPTKVLRNLVDGPRLKDFDALKGAVSPIGKPGFFNQIFGLSDTVTDGKMGNFVQSYLEFNANNTNGFLNNVKGFTDNLALSMMAKHHDWKAQTAVDNARKVIAGKFNYTTIGNRTQRIPKQFAPDAVTSYAKEYAKRKKDFDFPPGKFANGDPMSRTENLKGSIEPGGWVSNAAQDGWQWVRQDGTLLRDVHGVPFGFKFKDAINNAPLSTADLSKEMNQLPKPTAAELTVEKKLGNLGRPLTGAFEKFKNEK